MTADGEHTRADRKSTFNCNSKAVEEEIKESASYKCTNLEVTSGLELVAASSGLMSYEFQVDTRIHSHWITKDK